MLGLLGVIVGSLGDFVALGFAPQSLVVLVGASTIIINTFFAHFWLGEELKKLDVFATIFVLAGICIVSVFMNKGGKCYTLDELVQL
jgi:drug/metabolite transporter (DMT)-like permease